MTVTRRIKEVCLKFPKRVALQIKDGKGVFQPYLYEEFYKDIAALGAALIDFGVRRGDHIGIISDNRKEWIITDVAVMGIGAADVPRGSDSTENEIVYILSHSESKIAFMESTICPIYGNWKSTQIRDPYQQDKCVGNIQAGL